MEENGLKRGLLQLFTLVPEKQKVQILDLAMKKVCSGFKNQFLLEYFAIEDFDI